MSAGCRWAAASGWRAFQRSTPARASSLRRARPIPVSGNLGLRLDGSTRGGHRHHQTIQAAICLKGSCAIYNQDRDNERVFELNSPDQCLILEPKDWHQMFDFSKDAILMVLASEYFDSGDYIYEPYFVHDRLRELTASQ